MLLKNNYKKILPAYLLPIASWIWYMHKGLILYLAFLVGRIPNHTFRLYTYRHFFKVKIGKETSIHWRCRFFAPEKITIGHNTIIGNDAFLDGRYGLTIGNNVAISGEVAIFTAQHDPNDSYFAEVGEPININNYVYIGSRAIILPGVVIGKAAVVAAGTVVTKNVPPFAIVGGVPARKIGNRNKDLKYILKFRMPFQ